MKTELELMRYIEFGCSAGVGQTAGSWKVKPGILGNCQCSMWNYREVTSRPGMHNGVATEKTVRRFFIYTEHVLIICHSNSAKYYPIELRTNVHTKT